MYSKYIICTSVLVLSLALALFLQSCSGDTDSGENHAEQFDELPIILPEPIIMMEEIGEDYLTHLSYSSVALGDGSVLIGDRELRKLFRISADGELLEIAARGGRGPGEVQDVVWVRQSATGLTLLYDSMNAKLIKFDEHGKFTDEFIFPQHESGSLNEVYQPGDSEYLLVYRSFDYLYESDSNKGPETRIGMFDRETERHGSHITLPDQAYAPHTINGMIVGGRMVPFTGGHVRYFNPADRSLYVMLSDQSHITRFDTQLDTVETIRFELHPERVNDEDKIASREEVDDDDMWRVIEPLLPEYKALADDMKIDSEGNFWLKLNHRSNMQRWLVISPDGSHKAMVHLPKEAMLTHISEHHLGVRLDHHVFALFEPVSF